MIHNVPRAFIRMVSGEVIITDPPAVYQTEDDVPAELKKHMDEVDPFLKDIEGGYFIAYSYMNLFSVGEKVPIAIVCKNIATVTSTVAQIEAPEGTFD